MDFESWSLSNARPRMVEIMQVSDTVHRMLRLIRSLASQSTSLQWSHRSIRAIAAQVGQHRELVRHQGPSPHEMGKVLARSVQILDDIG